MSEIAIARVRVVAVNEITLAATADGLIPRTVTLSKLLMEPLEKSNDPRLGSEGTMVVPQELPFGRRFILVLCDPDEMQNANARKFKEDE